MPTPSKASVFVDKKPVKTNNFPDVVIVVKYYANNYKITTHNYLTYRYIH